MIPIYGCSTLTGVPPQQVVCANCLGRSRGSAVPSRADVFGKPGSCVAPPLLIR